MNLSECSLSGSLPGGPNQDDTEPEVSFCETPRGAKQGSSQCSDDSDASCSDDEQFDREYKTIATVLNFLWDKISDSFFVMKLNVVSSLIFSGLQHLLSGEHGSTGGSNAFENRKLCRQYELRPPCMWVKVEKNRSAVQFNCKCTLGSISSDSLFWCNLLLSRIKCKLSWRIGCQKIMVLQSAQKRPKKLP